MREAFESIQLDDVGIRAVEPREPYQRVLGTAAEDGMALVGATGVRPAAPPSGAGVCSESRSSGSAIVALTPRARRA